MQSAARALARQTILVIDDDVFFRTLVRGSLLKAGFEVVEASNGLEGVHLLMRAPIDLVITDMIMPEYAGVETILRIRQLCPELKILAMSGADSRDNYLQLAAQIGAGVTLEKSWIPDLLLASVRSLLKPA